MSWHVIIYISFFLERKKIIVLLQRCYNDNISSSLFNSTICRHSSTSTALYPIILVRFWPNKKSRKLQWTIRIKDTTNESSQRHLTMHSPCNMGTVETPPIPPIGDKIVSHMIISVFTHFLLIWWGHKEGQVSQISCKGTWDLPCNTEQILKITAEAQRPGLQWSSQCRLPEHQQRFLLSCRRKCWLTIWLRQQTCIMDWLHVR